MPTHRLVLCWQLTCTAGMCWHACCDILALCMCIYCGLHFDVEAVFQYLNGCRPTNVQGGVFDIVFLFLSQINPSAFSSTDILRMR